MVRTIRLRLFLKDRHLISHTRTQLHKFTDLEDLLPKLATANVLPPDRLVNVT